jgi:hypothetical protein
MMNLNILISILSCLKSRFQLIKVMLFITALTCLSILLMLFLIKIESRSYSNGYLYSSNARCDAIIYVNSSSILPRQYYAIINGERYPKRVPSFFNSSIDFDCLNSNSDVKVILVWNLEDFRFRIY